MSRYAAERGRAFKSIGATGDFGQTPAATGLGTGTGDEVFYTALSGGKVPDKWSWGWDLSGGTFTAVTVELQLTFNEGTSWITVDSSTNINGEYRVVTDTPAGGARLKITTYTQNAPTPRVTGYIKANY